MPTILLDSASRRSHRRTSLPPTRSTLADKLALLGQGASPQATHERLEEFRRLFAYRHSGAIVTRVGQGPRAWTRLPKPLGTIQVIRHLLGDRLPGQEPIWFGARSFSHSRWFCIDVDADRAPRELLADRYDLTHADEEMKAHLEHEVHRTQKPRPTFATRLTLVERALRRLGLDPSDPRQVLSLTTPSGGRHLYVFLDDSYHLEMIFDLLASAGLKHTPGEVELFPAINRALRLPFGHLPDHPHDPNAWIQFIDDYRNGRIHRFSLATLRANLDRHVDRWQRQTRSRRALRCTSPTPPATPTPIPGVPKSQRVKPAPTRPDLDTGIQSLADADALFARGIEKEGTRTQILKHLAVHLIWFRHLSADEAATTLTTWAMNPRHRSKDIAADLSKGTRKVADQIRSMCRWYAARKRTTRPAGSPTQFARFSRTELDALQPYLRGLEPEERHFQAEFLLHFLAFAKQHGTVADDGSGRFASPAVNAVIKKWPGCSHMKYLLRVDHAVAAGVLTLVKGSWHNHHGTSRARTYRLHVPVVPSADESLDHDAALELLTVELPLDGQVIARQGEANDIAPAPEENNADHDHSTSTAQGHSPALSEESPHTGLGAGPHQRNPQRPAPHRLPRRSPRQCRARRYCPTVFCPAHHDFLGGFVTRERERLRSLSTGVTASDFFLNCLLRCPFRRPGQASVPSNGQVHRFFRNANRVPSRQRVPTILLRTMPARSGPQRHPGKERTRTMCTTASTQVGQDQPVLAAVTCGVNIRGVPKAVWRRARANALQSGLPFKVYVIRLLERSQPIPLEPDTPPRPSPT